jgi:hypothetical protein
MFKKGIGCFIFLAVLLGIAWAPHVGHAGTSSLYKEGKFVKFQYIKISSVGGTVWMDKDGTLHVRDRTDYGLIQGSINGFARVNFNCDLAANGEGKEYGEITIYEVTDGRVRRIGWIGEWAHKLVDGFDVDGRLTAKGVGTNGGLLLRITRVYRVPTEKKVIEINIGHIEVLP